MRVNIEFMTKFFSRDERTIQLWVKEGMPREERGEYDIIKCSRWYIHKLRKENENLKLGDQTLYQLKKEEQTIKNEERELKLKKLKGELIDLNNVRLAWMGTAKIIVKYLDGFAVNLNIMLSGDANTLAKIRAGVNSLRDDISRLEPDYFISEMDDSEEDEDEEREAED